jgi:uncharacterized membrane protein
MYRINQKVKSYIFFVSRILVAVIVNLVVIPFKPANYFHFLHLVLLYVLLVLTGLLLKNHYIQIRCFFWSESQIMRL